MSLFSRLLSVFQSVATTLFQLRGHIRFVVIMGILFAGLAPLHAGDPDVKKVVEGDVNVEKNGDRTEITASNNSIIEYEHFDIEQGKTVQFIQPSSDARVLNRVLSGDPTRIEGNLIANGKVYLTNPSGIYFGGEAMVDVAQLYAVAGHMSNEDFLNGVDHFTDLDGEVLNMGKIKGNQVHLFGNRVVNRGEIVADDGIITMQAGDEVYMGDPLGNIYLKGTASTGEDEAAVKNSGSLKTGKGHTRIGAGDTYGLAIHNQGEVDSKNIEIQAEDNRVFVSGTLDASDLDPGSTGGTVQILGKNDVILTDLTVDTSGTNGGGTINIGGSRRGDGPLRNAARTYVGSDVSLRADAVESGDGGSIIVWSNKNTKFYGSLTARGGRYGGDGGFAEISGGALLHEGTADLTAPQGNMGTLLLDPAEIALVGGTGDGDDSDPDGNDISDIFFGDDPAALYEVYESELEGATSNIILEARNEIFVDSTNAFVDDSGDGFGDILIPTDINLTLRTRNDSSLGDTTGGIDLTSGVNGADLTIEMQGTGSLNIEASTAADSSTPGDVMIGRVKSQSGDLNISTGYGIVELFNAVKTGTGQMVLDTSSGNNEIHMDTTAAIDGPSDLIVDAGTGRTLLDSLGQSDPLNSVDVSASSIGISRDVTTSGTQRYRGAVLAGNDPIVESTGGDIIMEQTLDAYDDGTAGTASGITTRTPNGDTELRGGVGQVSVTDADPDGLGFLETDDTTIGGILFIGGNMETLNSINIQEPVQLGNHVSLRGSSIFFNGSMDGDSNGPWDLTLEATAGEIALEGKVGGTNPLRTLTATGDKVRLVGDTLNTTGDQVFNSPFELDGGSTHVLESQGGKIHFADVVDAEDDGSAGSAVPGMTVNTPNGNTIFDKEVGGANITGTDPDGLHHLRTDDSGVSGRISLSSPVTTLREQTYNEPVELAANATISGSHVEFGSRINGNGSGPWDLTIDSKGGGTTTFLGQVGDSNPLNSLTTNADGTTEINTDFIDVGTDLSLQDQVILGDHLTIDAASIGFGGPVDGNGSGPWDLTLITSGGGTTLFAGAVGNSSKLRNLTTNTDGVTEVDTGVISASEEVQFRNSVLLFTNASIDAKTITFGDTIDGNGGGGGPWDLTLDTYNSGETTFLGDVGSTNPLNNLHLNPDGITNIQTTGITASGNIEFKNQVILASDVTIDAGPALQFADGAEGDGNGPYALTLNTATGGQTVFGGPMGGTNPLASLTTNSNGFTEFRNASVQTTGDQNYNNDIVLNGFAEMSANSYTFGGPIDGDGSGPYTLRLRQNGTSDLNFPGIGQNKPLLDMFVDSQGDVRFQAPVSLAGTFATHVQRDEGLISNSDTIQTGDNASLEADNINIGAPLTAGSSGNQEVFIRPDLSGDADQVDLGSTSDTLTDTLALSDTELNNITAGRVSIGGENTGAGTISAPIATNGMDLRFGTGGNMTVDASVDVGSNSLTLLTTGDFFLNDVVSVDGSGNRAILGTEGDFFNTAGSGAISVTNGARWLVYSTDPNNNDLDGLSADFEEYSKTYPTEPDGSGNGLIYSASNDSGVETSTTDDSDDDDSTTSTTEEEEDSTTDDTTEEETTELVESDGVVSDDISEEEVEDSLVEADEGTTDDLTQTALEDTEAEELDTLEEGEVSEDKKEYLEAQEDYYKSSQEVSDRQAQLEEAKKSGNEEKAKETEEKLKEAREKLAQAQQKFNQVQEKIDPSQWTDQQKMQKLENELENVRQSAQSQSPEQHWQKNRYNVMDVESDVNPDTASAQQVRDAIVEKMRDNLQDKQGSAHPAVAGTVNKLGGKDPVKGVNKTPIQSVSLAGSKRIPEEQKEIKQYFGELQKEAKDWKDENILHFRIVAGGQKQDWGFGSIDVFLNRKTGKYVMKSSLMFLGEGSSDKGQFEEYTGKDTKDLKGESYSFTASGSF